MALITTVLRSIARRSLAGLRARRVGALVETGQRHRADGNLAAALSAFQAAAALEPDDARLHYLVGAVEAESGAYARAQQHLERALALDAGSCAVCTDLGNVYYSLGDRKRAAALYARALDIDPGAAAANYNLAQLLRRDGEPARALPHLERAHPAAPARGDILRALVSTLIELGQPDRAVAVADAASAADPTSYDAWLALGLAHQKLHRSQAALEHYDRAAALRGDDAELFNNRAIALQDLGRLPEALADYDAALALEPDFAVARFHRALARLLGGDYAGGWPDYETRLLSKDADYRESALPAWDGAAGRRVLVHGEQGLGDEIMFASCLPDLLSVAGASVVTCAARLTPIFARSFPSALVLSREDAPAIEAASARVDCDIRIGSLPLHFRRARADFPQHAGYLLADPQRVSAWRERLAALGPAMNIGLSWRGGTHKSRRPVRSLDLARLEPVLNVPGTRFVSLQYTEDAQADIDAFTRATGIEVVHWPEAIADYDETAALICALDLTVSVCTAVIHLSGALGRPVWVMAPYGPEWRYGHSGEAMPWYPAARVVRQPGYGDWGSVIAEVATRLGAAVEARAQRNAPAANERLQRI